MGVLAGIIGVSDLDTRLALIEQSVVYDAVDEIAARYQRQRDQAQSYFVAGETQDFQKTYKLPGGQRMQKLDKLGRPFEQRPTGSWAVGFPIWKFGTAVGWTKEEYAYMTVADLENLFTSASISNNKTHRYEILRAIFESANSTFADERHGNVAVKALANTDGTLYPPVVGSETEAEEQLYTGSNYTSANISDVNNPFVTARAKLKSRNDGQPVIVAHINSAQRAKVKALTQFVDADTQGITAGNNTARATAAPATIPGEFLGVDGDSGVYVYEWDNIPPDYMIARDLTQPRPLRRRLHIPAELRGFKLEADVDMIVLGKREWIDRFGYGVENRLGTLVMQFVASPTYTKPAGY